MGLDMPFSLGNLRKNKSGLKIAWAKRVLKRIIEAGNCKDPGLKPCAPSEKQLSTFQHSLKPHASTESNSSDFSVPSKSPDLSARIYQSRTHRAGLIAGGDSTA